jgi:hypothetical protein
MNFAVSASAGEAAEEGEGLGDIIFGLAHRRGDAYLAASGRLAIRIWCFAACAAASSGSGLSAGSHSCESGCQRLKSIETSSSSSLVSCSTRSRALLPRVKPVLQSIEWTVLLEVNLQAPVIAGHQ